MKGCSQPGVSQQVATRLLRCPTPCSPRRFLLFLSFTSQQAIPDLLHMCLSFFLTFWNNSGIWKRTAKFMFPLLPHSICQSCIMGKESIQGWRQVGPYLLWGEKSKSFHEKKGFCWIILQQSASYFLAWVSLFFLMVFRGEFFVLFWICLVFLYIKVFMTCPMVLTEAGG